MTNMLKPVRDRIKELRRVRARELQPNPRNWRTHPVAQRNALRGLLAEVGYADALLARELSDGSLQLVDGHLRAETTPDAMVPVLILDVNETEANKILATLDSLSGMAETSVVDLGSLLGDVDTCSEGVQALLEGLQELVIENDVELKPVDTKGPPRMTWVLLGIPTVEFGSIASEVENISLLENVTCEMTSNNG